MLRSSNDMVSGQAFTVKVSKQPDGTFKATCKNVPKLEATSKTASGAMAKVNDLVNTHIMTGS